jgi:hypothetical protein
MVVQGRKASPGNAVPAAYAPPASRTQQKLRRIRFQRSNASTKGVLGRPTSKSVTDALHLPAEPTRLMPVSHLMPLHRRRGISPTNA